MSDSKVVEVKRFESNGNMYDYNKIPELPSGGSQYIYTTDDNCVYIRGLRAGEAKALARIVTSDETPTIAELMTAYESAIYGIDPWTLSEIDFSALMTYINIYTQSKAGWNVKVSCPDGNCTGVHESFITLFDLEFSEPKFASLPISFTTAEGVELKIGLPTIRMVSEYEEIRDGDYEDKYDLDILSYAPEILEIAGKIPTLDEAYKFIYNMEPADLEEITKIDDTLVIETKPLQLTCPTCRVPFLFEFSLTHQKAFALPRL